MFPEYFQTTKIVSNIRQLRNSFARSSNQDQYTQPSEKDPSPQVMNNQVLKHSNSDVKDQISKDKRDSYLQSEKRLSQRTGSNRTSLFTYQDKFYAGSNEQRVSITTNDTLFDQQVKSSRGSGVSFLQRDPKEEIDKGQFSDIMEDTHSERSQESLEMNQQTQTKQGGLELDNRERSKSINRLLVILKANQMLKKKQRNKKQKHRQDSETKIDGTKFKTELCKNWGETGKCNYGKKCQFAHGRNELTNTISPKKNEKYRSRKCKSYSQNQVLQFKLNQQTCAYGLRCQFIHENRSIEDIQDQYSYQKLLNNSRHNQNIHENNESQAHSHSILRQNASYDIISITSGTPRCETLKSLEVSPQKTLRQKSEGQQKSSQSKTFEIIDKYYRKKQSKSQDRNLIQKWFDSSQKGVLIQVHKTSSEEKDSSPSSDNQIFDIQSIQE